MFQNFYLSHPLPPPKKYPHSSLGKVLRTRISGKIINSILFCTVRIIASQDWGKIRRHDKSRSANEKLKGGWVGRCCTQHTLVVLNTPRWALYKASHSALGILPMPLHSGNANIYPWFVVLICDADNLCSANIDLYLCVSPGTRGTGPERTTTQVFFCVKAAGQG